MDASSVIVCKPLGCWIGMNDKQQTPTVALPGNGSNIGSAQQVCDTQQLPSCTSTKWQQQRYCTSQQSRIHKSVQAMSLKGRVGALCPPAAMCPMSVSPMNPKQVRGKAASESSVRPSHAYGHMGWRMLELLQPMVGDYRCLV